MLRARAHLAHGGHHDLLIAAEGFGSEPESGPVVLRRCKGREQAKGAQVQGRLVFVCSARKGLKNANSDMGDMGCFCTHARPPLLAPLPLYSPIPGLPRQE